MNELFGIEPAAYSTAKEWGAKLASFGPHSGRYLLVLPSYQAWSEALLSQFSDRGELDQKRIRLILKKASDQSIFLARSQFDRWPVTKSWLDNTIEYWRAAGPKHKLIFVHELCFDEFSESRSEDCKFLASADEFLPLSPSDEEIETQPEEYWKVSQWLCQLSAEIHLIDPYFNPLSGADIRKVFVHYVEKLSQLKKPIDVHFWVRAKNQGVEGSLQKASQEVENLIKDSARGGRTGLRFHFHWVLDELSTDRLHARFLLTEKGGIKFDQGFQILRPFGKKNTVSPIGLDLHRALFERFTKQTNAFTIERTIKVSV